MATETEINKHYFRFGVNKYFRGDAHKVEFASFGEKKDPVGAKAYLAVEGKVARKHLVGRVKYNTTATIDWNKTKKSDVEVNGSLIYYGVKGKAGVKTTFEEAKRAKLKLISFSIDEGQLKKMLNNDANAARNYLADEGKDGRIVSELWVAAEAKLATHFQTSTSFSLSANASAGNLEITAKGGSEGTETISLASGTTFAYALHKVKKWNKGKTKIENMEDDYKGMG